MRHAALLAFLALAAPAAAADRCPRSRALDVGSGGGALFRTAAPFEHFGASRTQVFPFSCTLAELTGSATPRIDVRTAPGNYDTPYSPVTRGRGELFVYGYGPDAGDDGAFLAKVDAATLAERWRARVLDPEPEGQWSYPGVALAHANGFLYAVYGNRLAKIAARTGRVVAVLELPEDAGGTGAVYNGMIVLPDGTIAAKKIERGPCAPSVPGAPASAQALAGLQCSVANGLPSVVVLVDPRRMRVRQRITTLQPVTGRITFARGYLYAAGRDDLFRYRYRRGRLALDRTWGPVRYRADGQTPGTGPGLLGRFLVVQTNFLPATKPLTVTAVDTRDSSKVFRFTPFPEAAASIIVSKAALDAANMTVVTHDTGASQMAALRLDPKTGFSLRWRRPLRSLAFSALVGPPAERQIVIPDSAQGPDEVVWLDEATGEERARSAPLASTPAPGNIVVPGFDGRFYYVAQGGDLIELRPEG